MDEKLEFSLAQVFLMPVVFGGIKMTPVLGKKKSQQAFSERQMQLANLGNNISFPRVF